MTRKKQESTALWCGLKYCGYLSSSVPNITFTYNFPDKHLGGVTYGGYSDSIVVDQRFVLRVPSNLKLAGVAPLLCAGITTYSPMHHWGVTKGKKVGVVGLGGLGHMGVKFAHALGTHSVLERDMNPQASDADLAAVVAGNTAFALKVFPLLDSSPSNNTFFSPYCLTQAFALLAPGARGETLSEIEHNLSFPLPQDRINPVFNKLDLLITGKTSGNVVPNSLQTPMLYNANAVWGQRSSTILAAYLNTLAVNYGAELHLVDYINTAENSRKTINNWVEEHTNNRIQNLIPRKGISTATRLVLTNAIWFKANWSSPFSKFMTANKPFTNQDGSLPSVPFMRKIFTVPHALVDGVQAVDIPYAGGNLSMLVIMPPPGTLDAFESALTPTVARYISNHLKTQPIDFAMPKFTFTKVSEMSSMLKSLGMVNTFDSTCSDLSGIDGKRDLNVGAVSHQLLSAWTRRGQKQQQRQQLA